MSETATATGLVTVHAVRSNDGPEWVFGPLSRYRAEDLVVQLASHPHDFVRVDIRDQPNE